MATFQPLKNSFGPDIPRRIADMIRDVHPAFTGRAFVREALAGYDELELTPRARQIAAALGTNLPNDFPTAADILVASLGPERDGRGAEGMSGFLYLPHVYYVAQFGLGHFEPAMRALYELTKRFTAEFGIRAFIERYPDQALARLRSWTADENVHVRRLVSEGTRPRLPWAPVLRRFVDDPSEVLPLLELLRDDPELYVRRSVANNLNDIAKDHPDLVAEVCARWMQDAGNERQWVVQHALRTLVKRGDAGALDVLGYGAAVDIGISAVAITPAGPAIGGKVRVAATLTNGSAEPCRVLVDLRVHFVKAGGATSPKVFKLTTAELAAGASVTIGKLIALHQQTTRTHYPGSHPVEVLINGRAHPIGSFELQPA